MTGASTDIIKVQNDKKKKQLDLLKSCLLQDIYQNEWGKDIWYVTSLPIILLMRYFRIHF